LNTILNLIYSAILLQEEHNVKKAAEHEEKEKKKKIHHKARRQTIEKKDMTDLNDYERDNTEYHDIESLDGE